jgi:predicted secreted hydrolase
MAPVSRKRKRIIKLRYFRPLFFGLLVILVLGVAMWRVWQAGWMPMNQTAKKWYQTEYHSEALVSLPADDAPHSNAMEWWYYSGHLNVEGERRFSFHYVFFLVNSLASHIVSHASLVDHQTGQHYTAQRRSAGNPSNGARDSFDFTLGNWLMSGRNGADRLRIRTPEFAFDLSLESTTPVMLQGGSGLLDFKEAGSSYYYSRPRMNISGTAGLAKEQWPVSGTAWFDHQWGDFSVTALAWDWIALQLSDGMDIMLYILYDRQGEVVLQSGTLSRSGESETLDEAQFSVRALGQWTSPRTKVSYPMGWEVLIPHRHVRLNLAPIISDSEFDGRITSYMVYWEGPVKIKGSHQGDGYIEMSGYFKDKRLQPGI